MVLQSDQDVGRGDQDIEKWPTAQRYLRNVDIVTGSEIVKDETWWEVKSWRSQSKTNRTPKTKVTAWKFLDSKTKGATAQVDDSGDDDDTAGLAHKQFSLDRIALKQNAFMTDKERRLRGDDERESTDPPDVIVNGLNWQFQKFTAGVKKDIVNPTLNNLNDKFKADPVGGGSDYTAQSVKPKGIIRLSGMQSLLNQLREKGVDMAKEAAEDIAKEGLNEL